MTDRIFYPGQEWVYFKIYVKSESADMILVKYIYPYVRKCIAGNLIESWFFIRYSDPEYHIRLRLKLKSKEHIGLIINALYKSLSKMSVNRIVSRIMLDTYVREIERYEPLGMEICETIFEHDSEYVCSIIRSPDYIRWIVGATTALNLIRLFYTDDESVRLFLQQRADAYCREFNLRSDSLKQFNDIYRRHKSELEKIVSDNRYVNTSTIHKHWRKMYSCISNNLKPGAVTVLPSLIHMHFNRLFTTSQRLAECICYVLLERAVKSHMARVKYLAETHA